MSWPRPLNPSGSNDLTYVLSDGVGVPSARHRILITYFILELPHLSLQAFVLEFKLTREFNRDSDGISRPSVAGHLISSWGVALHAVDNAQ